MYGQQFYVAKQKRIPPMIHKLLTPLGLAIWYMDDGSRKSAKHRTYNIHTLGYNKPELERTCDVLQQQFAIHATLHKQRAHSWRMYIGSQSAAHFTSLVQEYVQKIPSMRKKLVT